VAAYLKSLPPARNPVKNSPNLVFRAAKVFVLHPERPTARTAPAARADAEYGRYLANRGALRRLPHAARRAAAGADMDRLYAGDASPEGFPANPSNLTPDSETGIGRWSEEDFLRTMRTGVNPRGDSLHPFMPWREYRRMTDDDLRAIYRYLRTLPPIHNQVPRRPPEPARAGG
jgi:hypothetical protein